MKVKVTRHGLTSCPSCLSHIEVGESLQEVECPFCGARLRDAVREVTGGKAMELLRSSRSGLVAAALAGLAFTACGEKNNDTNNGADAGSDANSADMVQEDVYEDPSNQDYAQAPVKPNQNEAAPAATEEASG